MSYGGYPEDIACGSRPGEAQNSPLGALHAKQQAYAATQANVSTNPSLGERLNGLVNLATAVSNQVEGVRGRLFGYGPPGLSLGNSAMKDLPPDTIEDSVTRLANQLEAALSTIGFLNSRL